MWPIAWSRDQQHDADFAEAHFNRPATSSSGFRFSGWTGACGGKATTRTVTMDAARSVSAGFAPTRARP